MRHTTRATIASVLIVLGAPGAAAQTPEPSERRHDGFYARIEPGVGLFSASSSTVDRSSRSFSGASLSWMIAFGGTVDGGLVIGGGLLRDRVVGLRGEDDETGEIDLERVRFSNVLVGPFFDFYPMQESGLHFEVLLGLADIDVHQEELPPSGSNSDVDDDPSGVGVLFGVGWEWWVAPALAMGPLVRISYASLSVAEGNATTTDVEVVVPSIALSLTYH